MKRFTLMHPSLLLFVASCSGGGAQPEDARSQSTARTEQQLTLVATELTEFCTETRGDACTSCELEHDRDVDECWRLCTDVAISEGSATCVESCSRIQLGDYCEASCNKPPEECLAYGTSFAVTRPVDEQLLRGCQAAVQRDLACSERVTGSECELFARVEHAEALGFYECVESLPCDADASACFALPEQRLGDTFQAQCPESDLGELVQTLNRVGDWLAADVREDLQVCADLFCGSPALDECVDSWLDAVTVFW